MSWTCSYSSYSSFVMPAKALQCADVHQKYQASCACARSLAVLRALMRISFKMSGLATLIMSAVSKTGVALVQSSVLSVDDEELHLQDCQQQLHLPVLGEIQAGAGCPTRASQLLG